MQARRGYVEKGGGVVVGEDGGGKGRGSEGVSRRGVGLRIL